MKPVFELPIPRRACAKKVESMKAAMECIYRAEAEQLIVDKFS